MSEVASLAPQDPLKLAESQFRSGNYLGAVRTYEEYIKPGGRAIVQVLHNLVPLYLKCRLPSRALHAAETMTYFAPGWIKSWLALSDTRSRLGDWEGALRALHQALEVDPESQEAHKGRLFILSAHGQPDFLRDETEAWAERYLGQIKQLPPAARWKHSKIRVGYVSADFRRHVMDRLIEPLLRLHDRSKFDIYAYDNTQKADVSSEAMHKIPGVFWRKAYGLSDEKLAQRIRLDEIDVLVDLNGLTFGNRLEVFARRPARVQATWCGYLPTLGADCFDWKLADSAAGLQAHYTEPLWLLPSVLAFGPLAGAPEVSPFPAARKGCITFGVTNGWHKVSSEAIAAWTEILQALPDSRLVLVVTGSAEQETAVGILRRFGPVQRQVLFAEWQMGDQFPAVFRDVDIALDTFPYGGCATSFDTMWQGVPIVCVEGDRPNGRYAAHFMRAAGHEEFVAQDTRGYIARAIHAARDLAALSRLRLGLRGRVRSCGLFDIEPWVRSVEKAYGGMVA